MNNVFEYDEDGNPIEKRVTTARKLSNGKYFVNGTIKALSELSPSERAGVKALDRVHQARLSNAPAEEKRRATENYQAYLKKSL